MVGVRGLSLTVPRSTCGKAVTFDWEEDSFFRGQKEDME